jgi:hypothetical protein
MTAAYGAVIRVAGACICQAYGHACLLFTRARFMRAVFHARLCSTFAELDLLHYREATRGSAMCSAQNSLLARDRTPGCPSQRSHQKPELKYCVKGCSVLAVGDSHSVEDLERKPALFGAWQGR